LAALEAEKEQIGEEMDSLTKLAAPMLELIGDQESSNASDEHEDVNQLIQDQNFTVQYLRDKLNISQESLDAFIKLARFTYDVGQYDVAQKYLEYSCMLVAKASTAGKLGEGREVPKVFGLTWGKVAAELLLNQYAQAHEDILKLKDFIDSQLFSKPLEVLQQRSWLMHWCLFLLFFHPESYESVTEIFYSPKYLESMQTCCPWLIRYLSAAFVLHHNKSVMTPPRNIFNLFLRLNTLNLDSTPFFVLDTGTSLAEMMRFCSKSR
jgi:translation initiation factor 3 subunit E